MMNLTRFKVGEVYGKNKLTRTITKIDGNEIYYIDQKNNKKNCWVTTFEDWVRREEKVKCDYCSLDNTEENLSGDSGLIYNKEKNQWYIFVEFFKDEKLRIDDYNFEYCPICGRKLL